MEGVFAMRHFFPNKVQYTCPCQSKFENFFLKFLQKFNSLNPVRAEEQIRSDKLGVSRKCSPPKPQNLPLGAMGDNRAEVVALTSGVSGVGDEVW